ncbi:ORF20 [Xestia c-nigrum granulovirus]|uniref:ORF20 n=1 Tax=Xestia c-nigrum granulosis virus TaxID=51677 RepID=Q9PZ23_GVXN|nr:ORF20 [Xestia c-nigrum granulovirus]AAF05134.1 ORF20 [Xestia c-nigrum granulovirus]
MSYWYVVLIAIIFVVILFLSLKSSDKREPSPIVCGPSMYGNFPNPNDCSSFFLCAAGQAIQMFCSNGFLYDIHERTCVAADRVDCGDRPVR